ENHTVSLHKVNGSFLEVHDALQLHRHSHGGSTRTKRKAEEFEELVTSYSEPLPVAAPWSNKCLSTQDILETFGLEPHHSLVISPSVFLNLCPAIVYELDQRLCHNKTEEQHLTSSTRPQHSAWLYATLSVLTISLIGLLGVAMVPLVQKTCYQQLLHFLVALAVGCMSGDALLHLLPHALTSRAAGNSHDHITPVLRAMVTFIAIVLFFLLEALLHYMNSKSTQNQKVDLGAQSDPKEQTHLNENEDDCTSMEDDICSSHLSTSHTEESVSVVRNVIHGDRRMRIREVAAQVGLYYGTCHTLLTQDSEAVTKLDTERVPINQQHSHHHGKHHHKDAAGSVAWMVIMGDGLHNLTDGLAIGAAFSGDTVAGFATALAVLCHELPHELGDFAVLLQTGMRIHKAVAYNIFSSVLSFFGMAIGVWIGKHESASLWIYAFTAGTFLYISLVDLIPEMNTNSEKSQGFLDVILQLAGIITGASLMLIIALYEDDLSYLFG
ncbi:hypothetical protein B7P43_G11841, partial [Cryptotermes secundus]